MIARCENKNHNRYYVYGGKGILVCKRWKNFDCFLKDMEKSYKEGLTIDRIKNNGNYCKKNCRWVTWEQQSWNRSDNRIFKYNGVEKPLYKWIDDMGLNRSTIEGRLYKKRWSIEKSLFYPVINPCEERPVLSRNKEGLIKKYKSIKEAAKYIKISPTAISNNLNGRSKTCAGFVWEYL